ncbi:hybrid sensor histidine kinase/response regulator [Rubellimicrobium roseum]|uniref:histidine kinase n=1 Tax=Rubellimicrobium roseum TaxID=687525 RepID=A0A5C4NGZ1_9RHOB|nr:PAS domain-containing protein [Rubellimicrobium roseum]TNC71759.1 PAS domain S-box protein [Rubellimicrobium roseum]
MSGANKIGLAFAAGWLARGVLRAKGGAAPSFGRKKLAPAPHLVPDLDRAQMYLQVAGVMLLVLDREGRIETVNPRGAEILGHDSPAQLIGRDWFETAIPVREREAVRAIFAEFISGSADAPDRVEGLILRPDGQERLIAWRNRIIRDAAGRIRGTISSGEDITEARAADERVRQSEALLSAVLDALPVGVIIADPKGKIVRDNAAHRELWGVVPDPEVTSLEQYGEWIGYDPETGRRLRAQDWAMARALVEGETVQGELVECQRFGTGERRFFLNNAAPVRDAGGRVIAGVVAEQDVTDRRAVEQALRMSAERVQLALAAGAIIGTWHWDLPTDRFTVDEQFALNFGLDLALGREGLSLEQVIATVHPDDREGLIAAIGSAISRGGPYAHQYRVRRQDGRYYWIEANGRVDHGPDGTPLHFPGVLLDVEEHRALLAERDRATQLLKTFIEAVPGVVYAKDRQGRMLVANKGTAELIGKPPEEFLGRTDAEFLEDKAQAALVMANDRRIMDSAMAEQVEEAVTFADGTPAVWLSTKVPLRDGTGQVIGLIGASVDITARKAAEAELERINLDLADRVARAVAEREAAAAQLHEVQKLETIGQLTGGIAHDFNNLLTPIVGSLERAHRKLDQDERTQRLVAGGLQSAERARVLVQRLLTFARRQTLMAQPVDVGTLLDGMHDLIARSIGPQIDMVVEVAPDLPPAMVDANQLELALLNLAVNARDAMPGGGRLTISAAEEAVGSGHPTGLAPGRYVRLAVVDTGVGMSAIILARAVEPFFSTKGMGKGTGLGLSMVHGLAGQSGGRLVLSSRSGQGTRAEVWLPVASEAAPSAPAPAEMPIPIVREGLLLLVDDEELVRIGTADMLRDLGYEVVEANGGAAALQTLRSGLTPDLLVTDYLMPGMTGVELARAAHQLLPELPALLISGYQDVLDASVDGLPRLAKPFRQADLAARVAGVLDDKKIVRFPRRQGFDRPG